MRKYISKKLLIKWGLFLVLLGAAWMYDHSHTDRLPEKKNETKPVSAGETSALTFCFSVQANYTLKAPIQKITPEKFYQEKLSRFLKELIAGRSVYLRKAEVLKQPETLLSLRYLISILHFSRTNPDDIPIAS